MTSVEETHVEFYDVIRGCVDVGKDAQVSRSECIYLRVVKVITPHGLSDHPSPLLIT